MVFRYAYILPILIFLWFPIAFGITTILSYFISDIKTGFPFISDTGAWSPESCIFGFTLTLGTLLIAAAGYIRYLEVKELLQKGSEYKRLVTYANNFAVIIAIGACIGMIIVANFQEINLVAVHLLGAALTFGLGNVYMTIQSYISIQIYPKHGHKIINTLRIILTIFCSITVTAVTILGILAVLEYRGEISEIPNWTENDGGYDYKFWCAICEWCSLFTLLSFFLTFTYEFRKISLSEPPIIVNV